MYSNNLKKNKQKNNSSSLIKVNTKFASRAGYNTHTIGCWSYILDSVYSESC